MVHAVRLVPPHADCTPLPRPAPLRYKFASFFNRNTVLHKLQQLLEKSRSQADILPEDLHDGEEALGGEEEEDASGPLRILQLESHDLLQAVCVDLPISARAFLECFFADTSDFAAVNTAAREDEDLQVAPWAAREGDPAALERLVSFKALVNNPMCPPKTRVEARQVQHLSPGGANSPWRS